MKGKTPRETLQEAEYRRPYHHLVEETGEGIPYVSLLRIVRTVLAPARGDRIIDAGCGDGRLLAELSDTGALLFGIDASTPAIRFAAGFNPKAFLSIQNVADLGLRGASFTKGALVETLEHLSRTDAERAVSEMARVLISGGTLVVTVPTTLLPPQPKHYAHFTPEELRNILARHFSIQSLGGHDRNSRLYRSLVALVDNKLWHLRGGANRMLRWFFGKYIEKAPPARARRLIAVCVKP